MESVGLGVGTFLWLVIHISPFTFHKVVLICFASSKAFLWGDFGAGSLALGITVSDFVGFERNCDSCSF